jgi:hypothetical protein
VRAEPQPGRLTVSRSHLGPVSDRIERGCLFGSSIDQTLV